MSSSQTNEITIFLRPTNSQPYVIKKCSDWLYSKGYYKSPIDAYNHLIWLEDNEPSSFRHMISEYHRTHTFVTGYLIDNSDDSKAFRSSIGPYGEDNHMYFNNESWL
jgi:hypothetical protein